MSLLTSRGAIIDRESAEAGGHSRQPLDHATPRRRRDRPADSPAIIDCDVSWFITFAEKFVDGAVPYVDVTDPNPPAAFLSLIPAVTLARALGVAVEPVVAGSGLSRGLSLDRRCAPLIFRAGARRSREDWGLLLNAAVFLLLVAPEIVFAEREHVALLALAPMLATLAVRRKAARVAAPLRLLAGLGAGVAVCFKPFFAAGDSSCRLLALAFRERSPRLSVLDGNDRRRPRCAVLYGVGDAAVLSSLCAICAAGDRRRLSAGARQLAQICALLSVAPFNFALLAGARRRLGARLRASAGGAGLRRADRGARLRLASVGFLARLLPSGKGLAATTPIPVSCWRCSPGASSRSTPIRARATRGKVACSNSSSCPLFIAAPASFGAINQLANAEEHPGLRAEIARVAPAHPRVIALARQLDFGHPADPPARRNMGWTPQCALDVEPSPGICSATRRTRPRARASKTIAVAILRASPRMCGQGGPTSSSSKIRDTREWVAKLPETAGVLDGYEKTAQAEEIEIWTRKAR